VTRRVLIGVGNPYRRDDGVGPALAAEIDRRRPADVTVTTAGGEPTELIEAWSGADLAVLVDAVVCDPSTPGRIHRSLGWAAHQPGAASTHGLGVPEALRLAEALHRAPRRVVVFAVEAADVTPGLGLSAAVSAALPELTRLVLAEFARTATAER
jgi:hydrogenase maturation protease